MGSHTHTLTPAQGPSGALSSLAGAQTLCLGEKTSLAMPAPSRGISVYPEESSPTVDLLEVVPYFFVTRVCDVPSDKDDGTEARWE